MPDELPQLLDAWGRREASGADAALPPLRPSAGFLAAARRARVQRLALRAGLALLVAILIVMLIVMFTRAPRTQPAPAATPAPAVER